MNSAEQSRWLFPTCVLTIAMNMACTDSSASKAGNSGGFGGAGNTAAGSPGSGTAGLAGNGGFTTEVGTAGVDSGGANGSAGALGSAGGGGESGSAGTSGAVGLGGQSGRAGAPVAGAVGLGGQSGGAGAPVAGAAGIPSDDVSQLVATGTLTNIVTMRPEFGGLVVADDGIRSYVVESRRDIEAGPLGLPWRSRFRLAAYERGKFSWAFVVDPDDLIGDVVVHPSGDLTIAWEKNAPEKLAYRLVRLGQDGTPKAVTELSAPTTVPDSDFAATESRPLLRMKSALADATTAGWLRLSADGEDVIAVVLSYVDTKLEGSWSNQMALAIVSFDWAANEYTERWARIVDGTHVASPAAWAYDELRWREQAVRPFLTFDPSLGDWLVGRAWNESRCTANRIVFGEFSAADCLWGAVDVLENERLPLAVTRFSRSGERRGTVVIAPELDAAEQVPFTLATREGRLYVAGSLVRTNVDGTKRTYPDVAGYVDYDGYVGIYSTSGTTLAIKDVNLGRGDVLAALRLTTNGVLACGSSGWDRWQGGMSVSRGADPLLAWLSLDLSQTTTRTSPMSDGSRHFGLHDVAILNGSIVAFGFADAPMTHSADRDPTARSFGGLQVTLSAAASP